jgi:hypothetical protein
MAPYALVEYKFCSQFNDKKNYIWGLKVKKLARIIVVAVDKWSLFWGGR